MYYLQREEALAKENFRSLTLSSVVDFILFIVFTKMGKNITELPCLISRLVDKTILFGRQKNCAFDKEHVRDV